MLKNNYRLIYEMLLDLNICRHTDNPDFKYQNAGQEDKIVTDDRLDNKLTELLSKGYLLSEGEKEAHDDYKTSEDRRRRIEYLYLLFRSPEEYLSKKQRQVEAE
jgi:hypothetical protein